MKTNFFVSLLIAIAMIFIIPLCQGSAIASGLPSGKVVALRGKAHAFGADGSERLLKVRDPIFLHDTIVTGKRARLQLLFRDSSVISVGPDSKMTLAKYAWDKKTGKGEMLNKVTEGVFHVIGGVIAKKSPENFKTETPVATIGIRGSSYAFNLIRNMLGVVFLGGVGIDVNNSLGSVSISIPGYGTFVMKGHRPGTPFKFTGEQLDNILGKIKKLQVQTDSRKHDSTDSGSKHDSNSSLLGSIMNTIAQTLHMRLVADVGHQGTSNDAVDNTGGDSGNDTGGNSGGDTGNNGTGGSTGGGNTGGGNTGGNVGNNTGGDTGNNNNQSGGDVIYKTPVNFTGAFKNVLSDNDNGKFVLRTWSHGDLSGVFKENRINGKGNSAAGNQFGFNLDIPEKSDYDNGKDFIKSSVNMNSFPIGNIKLKPHTDNLYYSSLREFFILDFPVQHVVDDNNHSFLYSNTAFFGIPAVNESRPDDSVFTYKGRMTRHVRTFDNNYQSQRSGEVLIKVNWRNNKFIGEFKDDGDSAFSPSFFGTLATDKPESERTVFFSCAGDNGQVSGNNLLSSGNGGNKSNVMWMSGDNKGIGRFFGSEYQGIGGVFSGNLFDVASDMTKSAGTWAVSAGGFKSGDKNIALTGKVLFNGFVTGIAENMDQPELYRRFFSNNYSTDFSMTLNRNSGTLKGNFSAFDFSDNNKSIKNMEIGGARGSAYIDDSTFVALMGGNNVVHAPGEIVFIPDAGDSGSSGHSGNGGSSYGLMHGGSIIHREDKTSNIKPKGAYMVTDCSYGKLADHVSWGYWEAAYNDPETGKPYHIHSPGSLWVAGAKTPENEIGDLMGQRFKGHYNGKAIGVMTINGVIGMIPMNGTAKIDLDFSPASTDPVTGDISFPKHGLSFFIENGDLRKSGFRATIDNTINSSVNGGFFGHDAQSVGGNFHADLRDNKTKVIGIFGADRH